MSGVRNREYLIKYESWATNNLLVKSGKIKVKNCFDKVDAKFKLDKYLEKKLPGHHRLVVISCEGNDLFSMFEGMGDFLKGFGGKK